MLRDEALCSEGKSLLPLALDEPDTNYQGKGAVFYQVWSSIRSYVRWFGHQDNDDDYAREKLADLYQILTMIITILGF